MNQLESAVKEAAKTLHCQGCCTLFKIPEEMRQTPCDFVGYDRYGRIIMVECKILNRKSLPCGGGSGCKPHQLGALLQCHRAGGHAFLLWSRGAEVALLPMGAVESMLEGRKSLPWGCIDRSMICESNPRGVIELFCRRFPAL